MIHVWTDGACKGNPGRGGAGVVILLPDGTKGRLSRPLGQTTNNRAELLAVRVALAALAAHAEKPMRIHTDSQNVVGWLTGAFRVNTNTDLVAEIRQCLGTFSSVSFEKVRGHCGDPGNEEADRLAQCAAAGVTVNEWSSPSAPLGSVAQLHLELGALIAKVRQLRDPTLADIEAHLDHALHLLQQRRASRDPDDGSRLGGDHYAE